VPNSLKYGFYQLKDYANQRAIEINRDALVGAILQTREEYNAEMDQLLGLFAARTVDYKYRFRTPANARLQAMDPNGRALPIKRTTYDIELPLQMGGSAYGVNFVTRAKRTVQDENDDVVNQLVADRNWMRDHALAGVFYNGSGWSHTDDQYGTLTIRGLANGDATVYARQGGGAPATDNHYLAQAGAISVTNPYPTIRTELREHPENDGNLISFIADDLVSDTMNLASFVDVADGAVRTGGNTDVLVGTPGVDYPGRLIGYADGNYVVHWSGVPAGYIVSLTTEGPRPLAMREDPEAELQGFGPRGEREDYPFFETQWFRRAGFGGNNRVGATVTRIGNASYAIPTGYGSPMY